VDENSHIILDLSQTDNPLTQESILDKFKNCPYPQIIIAKYPLMTHSLALEIQPNELQVLKTGFWKGLAKADTNF
jgi:hypothetical protein